MMTQAEFDDMRAKFPAPTTGNAPYQQSAYCVGGAYCLTRSPSVSGYAFPSADSLETLFFEERKAGVKPVSLAYARRRARKLIQLNDAELFTEAWQLLHSMVVGGHA